MPSNRSLQNWLLPTQIREKYDREGAAALAAAAPRFLYEEYVADAARNYLLRIPLAGKTLDREQLKRRCGEVDRLWRYGEEEYFRLTAGGRQGGEPLHPKFAARLGSYHAERPFVAELADATLVGPEPIALTADRCAVLETTDANPTYLSFRLSDLVDERPALRALGAVAREVRFAPRADGNYDFDVALPLVKYHRSSFYHWVLEWLPKLRGLERYEAATGRRPTVLIRRDPPRWIRETMELAGWPMDRVETYDPDRAPVQVRRLVVPMHRKRVMPVLRLPFPDDYNPSREELRWLGDRMNENVPPDIADRDWPTRVYVSRANAEYNRVVNEDELVDALTPYGVERVVAEDHSAAEQVAMFSNAELIVAPHGSGLVNMVYADDPTVIELLREDDVRAFFFCLARELGYDYHYLTGPSEVPDMRIDPAALRRTVEAALP